jgi:L-arabinonolactonase
MLRIELLIDAHAELGEGPLWDVAEQRLFWIDSLGARVHSCDARGGAPRSWDVPEHIGSLALRQTGGAIVSLRDGFYALDFASGSCRKLVDPDPGKPRIRMNDGKVDRQGRFVAGYMDYEERDPICGLFRLDPGGSVSKIDDGIVCSNGPCWSPDGRSFYFADTYTRDIWAYDYDTETGGGGQPPRLLLLSRRGPQGAAGRRDRRRGRLRLERVGLRRQARPLRARRHRCPVGTR